MLLSDYECHHVNIHTTPVLITNPTFFPFKMKKENQNLRSKQVEVSKIREETSLMVPLKEKSLLVTKSRSHKNHTRKSWQNRHGSNIQRGWENRTPETNQNQKQKQKQQRKRKRKQEKVELVK